MTTATMKIRMTNLGVLVGFVHFKGRSKLSDVLLVFRSVEWELVCSSLLD